MKGLLFSPKIGILLENLSLKKEIYLCGGSIRDLLLKRSLKDLDITLPEISKEELKEISQRFNLRLVNFLKKEKVFRLITPEGIIIDLSPFREGAKTIEEDLLLRDYTINALAVPLKEAWQKPPDKWSIIDPSSGLKDIDHGIIRAISYENLQKDPLRMLRAYRLASELKFKIDKKTRNYISILKRDLLTVAKERVASEIEKIFLHSHTAYALHMMAQDGLLFIVFPEFKKAQGLEQPSFHHLDVFQHSLLALEKAEFLLKNIHILGSIWEKSNLSPQKQAIIKMAALFHDIGKPYTFAIKDRITFYEHDQKGAYIFQEISKRWRFSKQFSKEVVLLIKHHMRPFFLIRELRHQKLTPRAIRKLIRDCPDYKALFIVAMADSLASSGPEKDPFIERDLLLLGKKVHDFYLKNILVAQKRRLITGHDLIRVFHLAPGPIFKKILNLVEEAQIEGKINTKQEALNLVKAFLKKRESL